jgi:hypothetical protein
MSTSNTAPGEAAPDTLAHADGSALTNGSVTPRPNGSQNDLPQDTQAQDAPPDRDRQRAINDWTKSNERTSALRAIIVFIAVPGIFSAVIAVLGYFFNVRTIGGHLYWQVLIGGGGATFLAAYVSAFAFIARRGRYVKRRVFELEDSQSAGPLRTFQSAVMEASAASATADEQSDALKISILWTDTVERLDRYHKLVTDQADSSYLMTQLAAAAGFLILLSAAIVAAFAHTNLASGVAGGLGALGAAIAAYIGKTFQRSYEQANNRLLAYFQQPLDLSRVLISESLLHHLSPPAKDTAVLAMIEAAVSGGKGLPEKDITRPVNAANKT